MELNLTIGMISIICGLLMAVLSITTHKHISPRFRVFCAVVQIAYCIGALVLGGILVYNTGIL